MVEAGEEDGMVRVSLLSCYSIGDVPSRKS